MSTACRRRRALAVRQPQGDALRARRARLGSGIRHRSGGGGRDG